MQSLHVEEKETPIMSANIDEWSEEARPRDHRDDLLTRQAQTIAQLRAENERLQQELDDAHDEHQVMHGHCSATPATCSHQTENEKLKRYLVHAAGYVRERHPLGCSADDCNDECFTADVIREADRIAASWQT